jgi:hypothetical protein
MLRNNEGNQRSVRKLVGKTPTLLVMESTSRFPPRSYMIRVQVVPLFGWATATDVGRPAKPCINQKPPSRGWCQAGHAKAGAGRGRGGPGGPPAERKPDRATTVPCKACLLQHACATVWKWQLCASRGAGPARATFLVCTFYPRCCKKTVHCADV